MSGMGGVKSFIILLAGRHRGYKHTLLSLEILF